jgi:hypothetical protein
MEQNLAGGALAVNEGITYRSASARDNQRTFAASGEGAYSAKSRSFSNRIIAIVSSNSHSEIVNSVSITL